MKPDTAPPSKIRVPATNPRKHPTALVLQGGGALGAYQAGVYQAMHENDLIPDWVVGTSIGAINAGIIAGNPVKDRIARLRAFWERVSHPDAIDMKQVLDPARRANTWLATADAVTQGVSGFFSPRPFNSFAAGIAVAPENASFYDTHPLAETLAELIDFTYLHGPHGSRLTVNALKVTSGQLVSFDSQKQPIGIEHIMASGALPPGLPPVRIDGELYWDGGLYSNTPLETVLNDQPPTDRLCFMVDLWNAVGPEPTTLDEVQTRQKDVMFASRSARHIENYLRLHRLQTMIRALYDELPANLKGSAGRQALQEVGCSTTIHVVRIPYAGQDWHMAAKDINFSRGSIEWRWEQGYKDASRAIRQAGWLDAVADGVGVVVHELVPEPAARPTFA
ncbi:MAG: patatin-like phospholipase family protein [Herminiimonas sp.]|nr:patatin-like phospholipase family protein [Herminiimonas sp.]